MGLLTSVNNINNSILTDAQQKREEKQKKELQKIRNSKIEKYFTIYFDNKFKNGDTIENNILYLLQNKSVIIYQLKNEYKAEYERIWTQSEIDYIKLNYFKWINQIKKEYETINKIQLKKDRELKEKEIAAEKERYRQELETKEAAKIKKEKQYKTIEIIAYIILGVMCLPVGFLVILAIACCSDK